MGTYFTGFIEPTVLPTSGTYTILVDPGGHNKGGLTLDLYDVVDVAGEIVIGQAPVTLPITTPGQKVRYTFWGSRQQLISVNVASSSMGWEYPRVNTTVDLPFSSAR